MVFPFRVSANCAPSSASLALLKMPRKPPLDPVEARKVSQLCAKLLAGPQSLSAQNAAVKLAKQLAICPAAAAEVRRAGGVRRLQARSPRPRATRERSHDILRPLFRRSCAAWPLSHFCLSQAIAVFGEDGDGELAQLCARDAAQTALRLMGESTTPPVGGTPAPQRALRPSTPAASPSPAPSCLAGHERRGRGGGRRRLPPSASPHGRAHRCTRSRPSRRRGGRPTL